MSRRKVKKGRFLDKTEAEKQMEKKLGSQVSELENRLTGKIQDRMKAEAVERVGTTQGILAADREAQLAGKTDYGLAKNVALAAQYASNAVASATTGRRMGTIDEVQGDFKLAEELTKKEGIEQGYQMGQTAQAAQIDLGKAIADERGDLAKRGAVYNTASGVAQGLYNKFKPQDAEEITITPGGQNIELIGANNSALSNLGVNQPGGTSSTVLYEPRDIDELNPYGNSLAFGSRKNRSRLTV